MFGSPACAGTAGSGRPVLLELSLARLGAHPAPTRRGPAECVPPRPAVPTVARAPGRPARPSRRPEWLGPDQRITSGPAAIAAALKGRIHGCTRTLRGNVRFLLHRGRRPYMALGNVSCDANFGRCAENG